MAKIKIRVSATSAHGRIPAGWKEIPAPANGPGVSGTQTASDGVDDTIGVSGPESGN